MKVSNHAARVQNRLTLESAAFELRVIQQPEIGRVQPLPPKLGKTSSPRWPLDPPPVIELQIHDHDPSRAYLHSPYWFCKVTMEPGGITTDAEHHHPTTADMVNGTLTSSLYRYKGQDGKERGAFVFGDLFACNPGRCCLKFTVYEMRQSPGSMFATVIGSVLCIPFEIYPLKTAITLRESTALSRNLADAGVKLRIRKEPARRRQPNQDWGHHALSRGPLSALPQGYLHVPPGMAVHYQVPPAMPNHATNVANRMAVEHGGRRYAANQIAAYRPNAPPAHGGSGNLTMNVGPVQPELSEQSTWGAGIMAINNSVIHNTYHMPANQPFTSTVDPPAQYSYSFTAAGGEAYVAAPVVGANSTINVTLPSYNTEYTAFFDRGPPTNQYVYGQVLDYDQDDDQEQQPYQYSRQYINENIYAQPMDDKQ